MQALGTEARRDEVRWISTKSLRFIKPNINIIAQIARIVGSQSHPLWSAAAGLFVGTDQDED